MTVLLPNFKAVGLTQAELHSLKVEQLDVCIRALFANSFTHIYQMAYHPLYLMCLMVTII